MRLAERADVRYVVRDWLAKLQIVAAGLAITTLAPVLLGVLPEGVRAVAVRGEPQEARRVVVATETGLIHRLRVAQPEREFIAANEAAICRYMKMITPDKLLDSLRLNIHEVTVEPEIAGRARLAIERMIDRLARRLDLDLQQAANEAVRVGMQNVDNQLKKRVGKNSGLPQMALVALDPHTGEVKALIGGRLDLADLPAAWNEGMRDLLGITPPSDREGCLQDIHWFVGAWGYFPTYTLGAMTAAQP